MDTYRKDFIVYWSNGKQQKFHNASLMYSHDGEFIYLYNPDTEEALTMAADAISDVQEVVNG